MKAVVDPLLPEVRRLFRVLRSGRTAFEWRRRMGVSTRSVQDFQRLSGWLDRLMEVRPRLKLLGGPLWGATLETLKGMPQESARDLPERAGGRRQTAPLGHASALPAENGRAPFLPSRLPHEAPPAANNFKLEPFSEKRVGAARESSPFAPPFPAPAGELSSMPLQVGRELLQGWAGKFPEAFGRTVREIPSSQPAARPRRKREAGNAGPSPLLSATPGQWSGHYTKEVRQALGRAEKETVWMMGERGCTGAPRAGEMEGLPPGPEAKYGSPKSPMEEGGVDAGGRGFPAPGIFGERNGAPQRSPSPSLQDGRTGCCPSLERRWAATLLGPRVPRDLLTHWMEKTALSRVEGTHPPWPGPSPGMQRAFEPNRLDRSEAPASPGTCEGPPWPWGETDGGPRPGRGGRGGLPEQRSSHEPARSGSAERAEERGKAVSPSPSEADHPSPPGDPSGPWGFPNPWKSYPGTTLAGETATGQVSAHALPFASLPVSGSGDDAAAAEEDLRVLAEKIKRILDEEARRHGIDV